MDVRELGMQIAREAAARAWCGPKTQGKTLDPDLAEEFAGILYTFICKVKALEFGAEYYKGLLGQVDQALGGVEEANFANVPGKVMARLKAVDVATAVDDRLRQLAKDLRDIDHRSIP